MYVESDPTWEEALTKDDIGVDDIGITEEFRSWWHIELEGGDDDGEGRHIR